MVESLELEAGKGVNNLPSDNSQSEPIPWHHNLTPEERALIQDSAEHPLFEIIDGIPREEQKAIYEIIGYVELRHYLTLQRAWYRKAKELLTNKKGVEPTNEELMEDISVKGTPVRFKLWYIATFHDRVTMKGGERGATLVPGDYSNSLKLAEDYFFYTDKVHPPRRAA